MAIDTGSGTQTAKQRESLLAEFEPCTYDDWRAEAERALKGAPFDKRLLTQTPEGIVVQPLYQAQVLGEIEHLPGLPGIAPFARGARPLGHAVQIWEVCEEMTDPLPQEVGAALRVDVERGLGAVRLVVDQATRRGLDPDQVESDQVGQGGVSIASVDDMELFFADLDPKRLALHLVAGSSGLVVASLLLGYWQQRELAPGDLRGSLGFDPLGALARDGRIDRSLGRVYNEMAALTAWARVNSPGLRVATAAGHPYHDAGASAVEELAFALATGVEYLHELLERGISIAEAASSIAFGFSIRTTFFTEVAKLRAARLLWSQAVSTFGGDEDAQRMWMLARSSAWNATKADPWVNMLRATTETFAAVIGGADCIVTSPFDEALGLPDEFSRRISRNVQAILAEECHLGRVVDPAGGSRYIEQLTQEIAVKAWDLFREVEGQGGMAAALRKGMPQERTSRSAEWRADQLGKRKAALIGTNLYPNPTEQPLERREPDRETIAADRQAAVARTSDRAVVSDRDSALRELAGIDDTHSVSLVEAAVKAAVAGSTLGQIHLALAGNDDGTTKAAPLAIHRACDMYSRLRERVAAFTATHDRAPRVFLANMGSIKQHKARADFSASFFQVGGFEVLGNDGFATPEDAATAAIESGAEIAVICSTDQTYPDLVPRFTESLAASPKRPIVILAGYPKDQVEALRSAGVDDFIHIKTDNYKALGDLLERIGA